MHIHILGICGTFMGSLAILARELGHTVTGSDENVYPPMSTQLESQGIEITQGYSPEHLKPAPDLVVVGNAMSRGNPAVEYLLDNGLPYTSGPQWLSEYLLRDRWVLAVAGTHGKTTTASMLAWILEYANMAPGYLIGGVPHNFDVSARIGQTPFFVIEADEYDTAFFDKRSKFVHYHPRTLVLNNLEYDHADIFADIDAIKTQFHHLVRIVPSNGQIIYPEAEPELLDVLDKGCWTPRVSQGDSSQADWTAQRLAEDGSEYEVFHQGESQGVVRWDLTGQHNVSNGLMALIAARHVGVQPHHAIEALSAFEGVKRRMELVGQVGNVTVYDDFAHHPTAIQTTLEGLRARVGNEKIIAVIEPRSNTMRLGQHQDALANSVIAADSVIWYQPQGLDWSLDQVSKASESSQVHNSVDRIIEELANSLNEKAHIVIMSNGGFQGIHKRLVDELETRDVTATD